jgi:FADH2 O2-dependent halogenase
VLAVEPSSPSVSRPTGRFDFIIAGSGFSGSLLAWILASQGRSVLLIDKAKHPRFAVGESSTPTADFLLAYIAQRWNLKALAPLACWGQWKKHYPEIVCGKKRGFSYYRHHPGLPIDRSKLHEESLLVAASASDQWSDTHWLRSSVDAFLVDQACSAGVRVQESTRIDSAFFDSNSNRWEVRISGDQGAKACDVQATWLIDATGHHGLPSAGIDQRDDSDWMRTRTGALYGHFRGVAPFEQATSQLDPFCSDDAAQHHLLNRGWFWMLRFDNGITSVGLVEPTNSPRGQQRFWDIVQQHPSVAELMAKAQLVAPVVTTSDRGAIPVLGSVDRMSRCRLRAWGPGWVCLPVSYGFIDPLHSSGIAHSLSGVVRLADALLRNKDECYALLGSYAADLRQEVRWLDLLVAGCYRAQPSFANFAAFACMYFVCAIEFEKQLSADPSSWPQGFLQCKDQKLFNVVNLAYETLGQADDDGILVREFVTKVRGWIEPWNRVGLLDRANSNRIAHSVAPKYASNVESLCKGNPTGTQTHRRG